MLGSLCPQPCIFTWVFTDPQYFPIRYFGVFFWKKNLFLHNFNVMTLQSSNTKRYEPNFAHLLYTCKKEGLCLFTNAPEQPVYQVSNYQLSASNAGVEEQKPR